MRNAVLAIVMMATLIPSVGCVGARSACNGGQRGGQRGCEDCGHGCVRNGFFARHFGPDTRATPTQEGAGAPPSAQVAYPYYTNRGPRDFLVNDPPSIGN
ncbi:MAG TPA: hypothetical protein VL096_07615 [Pirellulaceae bacterium]|nr:hypothetical protein [Pirellulaceae bacterium]